ncbi:MAG: hypothetical protein AB7O60_11215 [Variibacter sp.]
MRLGLTCIFLPALLCAGCGADSYVGARAFSVQHQYDHLKCDAIVANIKAQQNSVKELQRLVAKADREPTGSLISASVYQPQLAQTQADLRIYQETAQEKGCPVSP